jgi:predicted dehydrogenase
MIATTRFASLTFVALTFCACLSFASSSGQPVSQQSASAQTPLRVGIAGAVHGHIGDFLDHSRPTPEIEVVGIAEPNQQLLEDTAERYHIDKSLLYADLETMIAKAHPQAMLVYTTTYDHRRVVEICARHGIHVMMEKPLAVSMEDALAIEKAAREAKIHVLVNYDTSYFASNHAAYDLAHSGAIGDVRKIVVHDGHNGPKEIRVSPEFLAWLTDPKLNGGGALFDFGCYGADLATWLMNGERPLTVTAVTQQIKPEIYAKVDDEATVILTYPKAQAILQASWNWPYYRKDMEVYGETGYAITVGGDAIRKRRGPNQGEEQVGAEPLSPPYSDSLSYFRAVIVEGAKEDGLSSLETNVTVTEILDAARRSAKEGKTIALPASR